MESVLDACADRGRAVVCWIWLGGLLGMFPCLIIYSDFLNKISDGKKLSIFFHWKLMLEGVSHP